MGEVVEYKNEYYEEIVRILTTSFVDDIGFKFFTHRDGKKHQEYVELIIKFYLKCYGGHKGCVFCVLEGGKPVSVCICELPDTKSSSLVFLIEGLKLIIRTNLLVVIRALRFLIKSYQNRVKEPHIFLEMIAVAPEARREGNSRPLIEKLFELDAKHKNSVGICLETNKEKNVSLYEKFGFEVTYKGSVGNFPVWYMFREKQ